MSRLLCAVGWHEWRCYDAVDATPHTVRAMSFWRNAHTARHPVQQFASIAQSHLWGIATSPAATERLRQAAYTHLCVIGAIEPEQREEMVL